MNELRRYRWLRGLTASLVAAVLCEGIAAYYLVSTLFGLANHAHVLHWITLLYATICFVAFSLTKGSKRSIP